MYAFTQTFLAFHSDLNKRILHIFMLGSEAVKASSLLLYNTRTGIKNVLPLPPQE